MANIASKRIKREFAELPQAQNDDEGGGGSADHERLYHIEPVNNNLLELKGYISGPVDTPFDGGIFKLEIKSIDSRDVERHHFMTLSLSLSHLHSSRNLPLQSSKGSIYHQDLASKHM